MKTHPVIFAAALALSLAAAACGAEQETLQPVEFQQIRLGGFWKQQVKRLTEKWLPHCIRQIEPGGAGQELLNLINTAKAIRGEPHGEYTGLPWSDAYVYNTLEAICLALAVDPEGDPELAKAQAGLRAKVEEWIPIILAAQLPDGYIHSFHTLNGHPHFSNIAWHEFYVMGYLLEAGVAHYRLTGGKDRRLYDAAVRCADHLDNTFGTAPKRTWKNGHPGLELALCRLGRLADEVEGAGSGEKYARLAKHFLDHQHEIEPNPYNQSNLPAVDMAAAEGHAVRATYFYTAMADMALTLGDPAYGAAADRIWANAIHRKHYLTGGVGASHRGEAFSADFDLRNDGYCESCAGCGLSFWSDRMHRLHGQGHYRDVQERVLYNNLLGAIELSGENFYYQNPLASDRPRHPWHPCPCCVGNIPRALIAIKDLMYSTNAARDTLYLSHFVDSQATIPNLAGASLGIRQETEYPWNGEVKVTLQPSAAIELTLRIRIPDRTESELYTAAPDLDGKFTVSVNGEVQSLPVEKGYVSLRRKWNAGDAIAISLPMDVQRVHCDERVLANRGRVALQRGPLTYNVEDVDQATPVRDLVLKPDAALRAVWRPDLLGGVMAIEGDGIRAIPNFARLNRGGFSQVWLIEEPEKIVAVPSPEEAPLPPPVARPDLDPQSVDRVDIGRAVPEKDHGLKGQDTASGVFRNRVWRHAGAGGWFSYQLAVKPEGRQAVHVTYWGDESGRRRFDILVDGQKIGSQVLLHDNPGKFFDVQYPIPEQLTRGKTKVTVRFQAEQGATAGGIFDLRILEGNVPAEAKDQANTSESSAPAAAVVRVDAGTVLVERPNSLVGANIEDLNFQLYGGLYSQLLHGECFEEHVDPSDALGLTGAERMAVWVVPDAQDRLVLRQFTGRFGLVDPPLPVAPGKKSAPLNRNPETAAGPGGLRFVQNILPLSDVPGEPGRALRAMALGQEQVSRHWRRVQTGTAAGKLTLVRRDVYTGRQAQEIEFVSGTGELGIDNAGLFREGIRLVEGKPYEGLLRIKSPAAQKVYVSLRAADGRLLAETGLELAAEPRQYQRLSFTLTPEASEARGRFALALKAPGAITVDYAFLQAGEWGRFKGLPVRREMAEALLGMGVATMRYNGSMVNRNPDGAEHYKWKKMIGPRDERVPYMGFFDPYASHGFSVLEFLDFCEAAGIWPIIGLRTDESAEDMADFVEYCLGGPESPWGRRRIDNGHASPYGLKAIEIGNEERMGPEYLERVKALGGAIWSKCRDIDVVLSVNVRQWQEEFADVARWARELGQERRLVLDSHYGSSIDFADTALERAVGLETHRMIAQSLPADSPKGSAGPYSLRLMPMEENGNRCDWDRGLAHAHNLNTMNRMPACLERAGTANTFQAHGLALIWDQGRIHFTPREIFFQPSYYVDRMFADEWLPTVVRAECDRKTLDVTAKKSADGRVLTVYLVNIDAPPVAVQLDIRGFAPREGRATQIGSDNLFAKNTPEQPEAIARRALDWQWQAAAQPAITLPGRSFTAIRLTL